MGKTSIQWTDATWNPIRARNRKTGKVGHYCELVSPGCARCYASAFQKRFGLPSYVGPGQRDARTDDLEIFLDEQVLRQPLKWKTPRRVFVCSMTDLFGDWVPDEWLDKCFAVMALTPQHAHQVLTKRPERMLAYLKTVQDDDKDLQRFANMAPELTASPCPSGIFDGIDWPLPNVWLGVSVENQAEADRRIPLLLQVPAAVRFLSCEPLLGPLDLRLCPHPDDRIAGPRDPDEDSPVACIPCSTGRHWINGFDHACYPSAPARNCGFDWVIVGGERGRDARPCDLAWVRDIVKQCQEAEIQTFVKQLGANVRWMPAHGPSGLWPEHVRFEYERTGEASAHRIRLRNPKGGTMEEWAEDLRVREFPEVAHA